MNRLDKKYYIAGMALGVFLFAASARAYVPPSSFIIKTMAAKRAGFKSVKLKSTVTAWEDGKPTPAWFKEITVLDFHTGILRSRGYDDQGKELFSVERRIDDASSSAFSIGILLLGANTDTVSRSLNLAGIPVRTEEELLKLETEEQRLASESVWIARSSSLEYSWVIGPRSGDQSSLWVEKDVFFPKRVRIKKGGSSAVDVRFSDFRYVRDFPYPRSIASVRAEDDEEEILFKAELNDLWVNPSDLSEMRSPLKPGFTEAGSDASGSVRDLIRDYYQIMR